MIEFLKENWESILVVVVFLAVMIFLALRGKKEIVYKMLYALVTEAEKLYGDGTGSLKMAYVVEKAYGILPPVMKLFISYEALAAMIERALARAKEQWAAEAGIGGYLEK